MIKLQVPAISHADALRGWLTDTLTRVAVEQADSLAQLGIDSTVAATLASALVYAAAYGASRAVGAIRGRLAAWRCGRVVDAPQPSLEDRQGR